MASTRDRDEQFVSVANIVKDLHPKVKALRKGLVEDYALACGYQRRVKRGWPPGAGELEEVYRTLTKLEGVLGKIREMGT